MKHYVILDFGASLTHTHHSRVIRGFGELLLDEHQTVDILLPIGSEIDLDLPGAKIRKKLLPSYHPVGLQIKSFQSYLPATIGKLFQITENTSFHRLVSKILKRISVVYTLKVLRKIDSFENLVLLFPTACPVTLELGEYLNKKAIATNVIYRLTNTAEKRGFHIIGVDLVSSLNSLVNNSSLNVRFGYEMVELAHDFPNLFNYLYYSPTPPCSEINSKLLKKDKFTISFLGMAQRHKGTKWLANLVESTFSKSQSLNIRWLIQTEEQVPDELQRLSQFFEIKFLPGRLTEEVMTNSFQETDLICLPYDADTYVKNASALAYRAADNLIPVATFSGSAFANEIKKYRVGVLANSTDSLVAEMLNSVGDQSLIENINNYNLLRKFSNQRLLDFHDK